MGVWTTGVGWLCITGAGIKGTTAAGGGTIGAGGGTGKASPRCKPTAGGDIAGGDATVATFGGTIARGIAGAEPNLRTRTPEGVVWTPSTVGDCGTDKVVPG